MTLIFLIENFFIYKLAPQTFWNFTNTVEMISSVGILLTANMLYLLPINYYEKEIINNFTLYYFWAIFCLLKFFRVIDFLMMRVKLKIIFKACIDVMPIFIEIILIYTVVNLVFSMIGMFLYAGTINTEFLEKYEEMTGDVIDEEYLRLNFNDPINSFIYWLTYSMNGGYIDLVIAIQVLQKIVDPTPWKMLAVKMLSYAYMIVMEMAIMNILIVFIGAIIDLYNEKNQDDNLK